MSLGLVCDSSLNLPDALLQEYGILEVPALVIFGPDAVYRNKIDMSSEEFYRRFLDMNEQPTTSQPAPAQFVEAYRQTGQKRVLCLTVSSRLSGTYNSAVQAAHMVVDEGIEVTVWDTRFASMGGGWQVLYAARRLQEEISLEDLLRELEIVRSRSFAFLTVDTLTYLARAGRVSGTRARVGNMLNIRPILYFDEGLIKVLKVERGRNRSKQRLLTLVRERAQHRPVCLAVGHAHVPEEAVEFLETCKQTFAVVESYVVELGPVLAAIGGPGLLGLTGYVVE